MVAQQVLVLSVGVRIPVPEKIKKTAIYFAVFLFSVLNKNYKTCKNKQNIVKYLLKYGHAIIDLDNN